MSRTLPSLGRMRPGGSDNRIPPACRVGAEGEEMSSGAWLPAEDEQLQKLAASGLSLKAIADALRRGTSSVRARAIKLNIAIAFDRNPMKKGSAPYRRE